MPTCTVTVAKPVADRESAEVTALNSSGEAPTPSGRSVNSQRATAPGSSSQYHPSRSAPSVQKAPPGTVVVVTSAGLVVTDESVPSCDLASVHATAATNTTTATIDLDRFHMADLLRYIGPYRVTSAGGSISVIVNSPPPRAVLHESSL